MMFATVVTSLFVITTIMGVCNVVVLSFLVGYDDVIGDEYQATIYRSTLVATIFIWGKDIVVFCHKELSPLYTDAWLF